MAKLFKILLITPPFVSELNTTTKDVHLAMERKPPLGILSIGTYLKENTDFEVKLLDTQVENPDGESLKGFIKDYQPDIVGITVVSFKLYSALRLTGSVKESCPSAHVCWGGPHLSIYPKESLNLPGVDSIILGDGEVPFANLCRNLSEGKSIENAGEGVYTKENEPAHKEEFQQYFHPDINELPLPDLTLLPYKKYRAFLTDNQMATAITSRGCPHRCIFCKLDFSKVRLLSVDKVIELMENYLKLGIKEVEFYDETFNLNTKRVIEFSREVIKRGLKFKWSFRGRVNAVNSEMLQLIKQAGCQRIQYGVEAGTDRVLKILKKGTDVEMIKKCFQLTNHVKIDTVAYFILGNPGETIDDMNETVRLAKEIRPTFLEYSVFNISPGTESYQMALEQGVIDKDYWGEFAKNPQEKMPVLTWTKDFSYEELDKIRKKALRSFYMRPEYIIKKLAGIRPKSALRVIKTGTGILKDIIK